MHSSLCLASACTNVWLLLLLLLQAWVLDTVPDEVRTGQEDKGPAGAALDHPRALIEALQQLPAPIASRNQVLDALLAAGESRVVAGVVARRVCAVTGHAWAARVCAPATLRLGPAADTHPSPARAACPLPCRLHHARGAVGDDQPAARARQRAPALDV
jgi:hypothetical protein